MKVYAFNVDETLEISNGPIPIRALLDLRTVGHIVGICGNLNAFCSRVQYWWIYVSFLLNFDTFPLYGGRAASCFPKEVWLRVFREVTFPIADDYIMVGNVFDVSGGSDDQGAAERGGWRFIKESDFAEGIR